MRYPGLEKTCPECKGAGYVTPSEWAEWFNKINAAKKMIGKAPDIDWIDKNIPMPVHAPEEIQCDECDGLGTVPTKIGLKLLGFIRKYL